MSLRVMIFRVTSLSEPQPVLTSLTAAALFLVATVDEGGEETVRDLLGDVPGLSRSGPPTGSWTSPRP